MVLRMRLTKKICRKKYLQVKIALEQPSPCCPPHPPHPPDPKLICEERSGYGNFLKPPSATQHWILGGAGGANDSNMSEYVPIRVVWIWAFFFYIFFSSTVPVLHSCFRQPKQTEQHKSFSIVLKIVLDFIVVYG